MPKVSRRILRWPLIYVTNSSTSLLDHEIKTKENYCDQDLHILATYSVAKKFH